MPTDVMSAADASTEVGPLDATESEPGLQPELDSESEAVLQSKRAAAEAKKTEGNAAFKLKQYKQAIKLYTEAAQLDPTCAIYFCNRSTCYANLGDWKGASLVSFSLLDFSLL